MMSTVNFEELGTLTLVSAGISAEKRKEISEKIELFNLIIEGSSICMTADGRQIATLGVRHKINASAGFNRERILEIVENILGMPVILS